jgi:hypothetical protein
MIVWITHAKVGHRQTPYKVKRPAGNGGAFCFVGLNCGLLEFKKTNSFRELVSVKTHIGTVDAMSEPQHAPKALVAAQAIGYNMAFGQ